MTLLSHFIQPVVLEDVFPMIDARFMSDNHCLTVHPANWQGKDVKDEPAAQMKELLNVDVVFDLVGTNRAVWMDALEPNLPWADDHFEERVCGEPINPGIQWAKWPWGNSASGFTDDSGMFNHNYMERYWPRFAGGFTKPSATPEERQEHVASVGGFVEPMRGIRNEYGDLNDIVNQLHEDPHTRQAYLPIFHPEDVGHVEGGRRPCTLGYQFIMRKGHLHCYYPMRSCDYGRHFADDVYMTIRLMEWVLKGLVKKEPTWSRVRLGSLHMHMTSLHMFINDYNAKLSS